MNAIWCIATADQSEIDAGDLDRLLRSAKGQRVNFLLVLRDVCADTSKILLSRPNVEAVVNSGKCGLSKARNLGLERLDSMKIPDEDWVAFPDDDCTYPQGLAASLLSLGDQFSADFIAGSYGESEQYVKLLKPLSRLDAMINVSSVCIFSRYRLIRKVGKFNEALGAGSAVFDYGEDGDFAFRLRLLSKRPIIATGLRVNHPLTEGRRNPKGYMTLAALYWNTPQGLYLLTRGILSMLNRSEVRGSATQIKSTSLVRAALDPRKLRVARVAGRKARGRKSQ